MSSAGKEARPEADDLLVEIADYVADHWRRVGNWSSGDGSSQKEFVVSWATSKMEKEMQERVTKEDKEIMDRVYNRELDPISASEKIFEEI